MNLEDDLRRVLADDRVALPGWPDPVARVRDGIRRRRRRAAIVAVLAAVAAVAIGTPAAMRLTAAPGGPPADPAATPSVIPFVAIPTPATTTASPEPRPTAAACRAAQLAAPAVASAEGATGSYFTTIEVRNTGPRCTLSGTPTLIALNKKTGERGPIPTQSADYGIGGTQESPATVDAGEGARVLLVTAMGCGGGANPTTYVDVSLRYAGADHAVRDLQLESTCQIQLGAWYRDLAAPSAPPPAPFAALTASLEVPPSVAPGATLEFVVVLTNPTGAAIPLEPCPAYRMDFGKFSYTTGLLNCQIQRIEPHHAARFAMRLAISTNTGDNPDHVYWTLWPRPRCGSSDPGGPHP
jgi:hypothetical protein